MVSSGSSVIYKNHKNSKIRKCFSEFIIELIEVFEFRHISELLKKFAIFASEDSLNMVFVQYS